MFFITCYNVYLQEDDKQSTSDSDEVCDKQSESHVTHKSEKVDLTDDQR